MAKQSVKKYKENLFQNRQNFHTGKDNIKENIGVNLGFRNILFAQTFKDKEKLVEELAKKTPHAVNIAPYVQEPQVLTYKNPNLTIDPSLSFRLEIAKYNPLQNKSKIVVRLLRKEDIPRINKIYETVGMLPIDEENTIKNQHSQKATYFIAEKDEEILGIVIGIDHKELFNSPEEGASLWSLAVMPGNRGRGIGRKLIRYLIEHYQAKGRSYLDLIVDYYNKKAIYLYRKLGFRKIKRFTLNGKSTLPSKYKYP